MMMKQQSALSNSELQQAISELRNLIISSAPKEFYTLKETRSILGMSRSHIHFLAKSGRLELRKVGKKGFVTKESIDILVLGHSTRELPIDMEYLRDVA
jgi:hypothetical protein